MRHGRYRLRHCFTTFSEAWSSEFFHLLLYLASVIYAIFLGPRYSIDIRFDIRIKDIIWYFAALAARYQYRHLRPSYQSSLFSDVTILQTLRCRMFEKCNYFHILRDAAERHKMTGAAACGRRHSFIYYANEWYNSRCFNTNTVIEIWISGLCAIWEDRSL